MRRLFGLCLVAVMASCRPPLPTATPADAARANLALADLEQGRTLVVGKCGGCHRPPLPASHTVAEWPRQVDAMAERSKLTAPQHQLIVDYFVTMADRPR